MSVKIDELFYELEVRTSGVKDGVESAERSLNRFTKFVIANPMAAVAALGAATAAVGVKATAMAAEVEKAGRRIETVFPGITKSARGMSNEFGVAQEAVLRLMDTIEKNGEQSRIGLEATARAALRLNQALGGTPEDLQGIAGALDQVLDLFHLTGDSAERVSAQLFAISKGRVPLNELVDAFRASASTIRDHNLSLDEAAGALTKLLESGLPARQAASALAEEIGKGRDSFAQFVGPVDDATKALTDFDKQVTAMGESTEVTTARIRERLSNAMIDLGNKILPVVAAELEGIAGILDRIGSKTATDARLSELLDLNPNKRATTLDEKDIVNARINGVGNAVRAGNLQLGSLSESNLRAMRTIITGVIGDLTGPQYANAQRNAALLLSQINPLLDASDRAAAAARTGGGRTGSTPAALQAGEAAIADLQKTLASFTSDLADDTVVALAKFRAEVVEIAKTIPPELAVQFKALTDQIIAQFETKIAELKSGVASIRELELPTAPALTEKKTPAQQRQANLDTLRGIPNSQTLDTQRFTQALDDHVKARRDAAKAAADELQATLDTARLIDQAVQGALDLAGAFGAISDETKAILSDLSQVATGIGPMLSALRSYQSGAGGFGALLATTLPVVGGIASLVSGLFGGGDSPAETARRQALEHNSQVIQELTATIGNLGLPGVTGTKFAAAQAVAGKFDTLKELGNAGLVDFNGGGLNVRRDKLEAQLKANGTSRQELQDLADALGVQADFFTTNAGDLVKAFDALNEAMAKTELTRFATTFAGQLESLQAEFAVFDIDDPLKQLQRLVELAGREGLGSPAIAQALQGLDLSTTTGREAAEKAIQQLILALGKENGISAGDLGGLDGAQFKQILLELESLLDQVGAASGGQTEGFAVSRTITEVTGSRLAGILTSQDARLAELVELGRAEVALLSGRAYVADASLAAAATPVPAAGGGDLHVSIEQLQVTAPPGTVDPAAWGQAAGKALAVEVDAALGGRMRTKARHMGSALTTG